MNVEQKAKEYLKAQCQKRKEEFVIRMPEVYIADIPQAFIDGYNEALNFTARTRETTWQERYEKQKEINKEIVDENEALRFATSMSEKTELQLREENANLKERLELLNLNANIAVRGLNDLLTKAKELIKGLLDLPDLIEDRTSEHTELIGRAEQFLEEEI